MSNLTPMERLTKARIKLILDEPFFGSIALRLKMIIDNTCSTAWVDGKTVAFNEHYIATLSDQALTGLFVHETMHVVLAHSVRKGTRDHGKFNRAGDYAINLIVTDAGFTLPEGGLLDEKYRDCTTETIYNRLPNDPTSQGAGGAQGGDSAEQGGQGQSAGSNSETQGGASGSGTELGDDTEGSNRDGSSGQGDYGGCGECRDAKNADGSPLSKADAKALENEVKIMVKQAAQTAKKAGKLPGGLKLLLDDLMEPQIDWQTVLQRFADAAAKNDYSYRRPNRRAMQQGLILPSVFSNDLGVLVVLVDTSGSISHKELTEFGSELSGILEEFSVHIHIIYVDTEIAGHQEVTQDDLPLELEAKGGGGTNFECVTDWLQENDVNPSALICLTDGYVYGGGENDGWFEQPDCPSIIVLNHNNSVNTPEWAETLSMQ